MHNVSRTRRTHAVYQPERARCQEPYPASRVPRIPFRLRDRLIPSNPETKRPWRYREVGLDAPLWGKLGPTTEDKIAHWQETLPPSQWLIRCGHIDGIDDGLSLVVLDVDYPGRAPAKPLGAWQVKTRRGVHWYTWTDTRYRSTSMEWGEIKADGGLVLAPGSRHPDTGQVYTPERDFGELVDGQLPMLPPELMPVSPQAVKEAVDFDRQGDATIGSIPTPVRAAKGERWTNLRNLLCRVAGSPARRGDAGLLLRVAHWYNGFFAPPMTDDRVERLANDVARESRSWGDTQGFIDKQTDRGRQSGKVRQPRLEPRNVAIRAARESGMTVIETSKLYGVSRSTIMRACGHG